MRRQAAIALVVLAVASPSFATPRIESVSVRPNPVPLTSGKLGDVVIAVSIERPTPIDLRCEAVVYPGDGGEIHLAWNLGDSRTKTARYEYRKAGSYKLKVTGSGDNGCSGERELTVKVGGAGSRAQSPSKPPSCPGGWVLVEDSVDGARYTCRPRQPTRALRCAEGTTYFSERGEIGCR